MTSVNIVEDPLMSVEFYINSNSFFISCYSPSTVFILLQKTLKSEFLPPYESLKLNHGINYLMTSEDTVKDPLMSVEFYINSNSFFISCYSPSTVFILLQKTLKSVFLQRYESLKLNNDANYLMTSVNIVEDPLMSVEFYINSNSFFISCYSPSTVFILLQKTLKSEFLPPYESLKLNHGINYLMTSEDTVKDPLMSVEFYINSNSFFISCYSPSTVFILLQKTLKSVFLQRYESLKLNHDTNYLMTSVNIVEDPLRSVQFYIKSKIFSFLVTLHLLYSFCCKGRLNLYFYHAMNV